MKGTTLRYTLSLSGTQPAVADRLDCLVLACTSLYVYRCVCVYLRIYVVYYQVRSSVTLRNNGSTDLIGPSTAYPRSPGVNLLWCPCNEHTPWFKRSGLFPSFTREFLHHVSSFPSRLLIPRVTSREDILTHSPNHTGCVAVSLSLSLPLSPSNVHPDVCPPSPCVCLPRPSRETRPVVIKLCPPPPSPIRIPTRKKGDTHSTAQWQPRR